MLNVFSGKAFKWVEKFMWPDCYKLTES
jgi:hypothetical protein